MVAESKAPKTINRRIASLSSFYKYLHKAYPPSSAYRLQSPIRRMPSSSREARPTRATRPIGILHQAKQFLVFVRFQVELTLPLTSYWASPTVFRMASAAALKSALIAVPPVIREHDRPGRNADRA